MDTRKIQTTGGGTYTVSLPKEWAEMEGIAAGDVVNLHTHIDGVVAIQTRRSTDTVSDPITVRVDSDDSNTLERTLRAAYGAGTTEVTFDTSEAFSGEARRTIGRVVRNLTGVSVARESDTQITVQTLLDPEEVSVRQSVRQLKFVALSMHRDATAMLTDNADSGGLADCDDQADRLYALIDRSVTRGLSRLDEVDALGLTRPELFELWTTTRELERVADHAERIVTVATKLEDPIGGTTADEIHEIACTAREIVADAVSVTIDETDVETAQRALHSRDRIREKTATFDRQPTKLASPQLELILQELWRTAEHGGNIAELGLQRAIRSGTFPGSIRTIESDEDAIEGQTLE